MICIGEANQNIEGKLSQTLGRQDSLSYDWYVCVRYQLGTRNRGHR